VGAGAGQCMLQCNRDKRALDNAVQLYMTDVCSTSSDVYSSDIDIDD